MSVMHKPTRSAVKRAAELRDDIAEAERQMGTHFGTPLYGVYLAQRDAAKHELEAL